MPVPLCRHIMASGLRCQSPALTMQRSCYFHRRQTSRHKNFSPNPRLDPFFEPGRHIRLLPVEDRSSLQMAISQTVNALATGQIEIKYGRAILFGLSLAAQQIRELEAHPQSAPDPARVVTDIVFSDDHLDLVPPSGGALEGPTLEGQPYRIEQPGALSHALAPEEDD